MPATRSREQPRLFVPHQVPVPAAEPSRRSRPGGRPPTPPRKRTRTGAGRATAWLRERRSELLLVAALVLVAGAVHAIGMRNYPDWVDDPGTYLSLAWSVQYWGQLSPYSYFYDHAPFGWIQIALWSMLTNGFGRHDTAMSFGNECMLLAKVASTVLLYALARRYSLNRTTSALAVLLFALCPLALHYTRITYLDNLTVPWLLLTFWFAADRRGHLASVGGATVAFSMAVLTKETVALVLPVLVYALWQNSHRSTRAKAIVVAAAGGSLILLYPALALVKGELFPGPDHNSLIGTAIWQLHERAPSGSVLDASSATRELVGSWLVYDKWLLLGGAAAAVISLLFRRLRPAGAVFVVQSLIFFTGGYVPFMHVINLLPWAALLVCAVPAYLIQEFLRRPRDRRIAAAALVIAMLALVARPWAADDHRMMTVASPQPLAQADAWVGEHVARDSVVVVHDALWNDLVYKFGFAPKNVIIVYKLDADPAVNRELTRIDYLVLPDYYYVSQTGKDQYPTAIAAKDRSVPVAHFGEGKGAVTVYRVSDRWQPRG